MDTKPISINDHTMIVVKTHADLELQGWDKAEIQTLGSDRRGVSVFQEGDIIRVHSSSDLNLTVPFGVAVTVERASGDANIRNLGGHLQIQRVGGDLALFKIASAEVLSVGGDCAVFGASGSLAMQRVGGDFKGAELGGPARLDGVGGDIELHVDGNEVQARAGGDLSLRISGTSGQSVRLSAGGDVLFVLSGGGAALDLRSRGHDIEIQYGGNAEQIEKRVYQATLGDGNCKVSIDAGGDIRISDDPGDMDDYQEWVDELEEHWHDVEENQAGHSHDAEAAFSFRADELSDQINRHVDEAMRQADSRVQEAMKRLEQRTRRLERQGYGIAGSILVNPPTSPMGPAAGRAQPAEKKSNVSDDEKLLILKMLQDKKITADEAEKLLEALEG